MTTEFFKNISEDKIIDYEKLLCTEEMLRCSIFQNGQLYYLDKIHMSSAGATLLIDELSIVLENFNNN